MTKTDRGDFRRSDFGQGLRIGVPRVGRLLLAVSLAVAVGAHAADADDPNVSPATQPSGSDTAERLDRLERRQERLEETIRDREDDRIGDLAHIRIGSDGFRIESDDGDYVLDFGGLIQTDARFVDGEDRQRADTFVARRVRPILNGTVTEHVKFRIMPDFGNGNAVLADAWIDFGCYPMAKLRVGKFKAPFGQERLRPAAGVRFVEFSLSNQLAPGRDVGAMLHGTLCEERLTHQIGLFNGVPDGASRDTDADSGKELAARAMLRPFRNEQESPWRGLSVGAAVTVGVKDGAMMLPSYRTAGQETFFAYRPRAEADGMHYRVAPQARYYRGPFGVMGEWIRSSQEVSLGTASERISNEGWMVMGTWVVTGEDASYASIDPESPFEPDGDGWGALEFAARYSELHLDDHAFPVFASAATSANTARAVGLGWNWYLNENLKIVVHWEHTMLSGGAVGGDRDNEDAAFLRLQLSF